MSYSKFTFDSLGREIEVDAHGQRLARVIFMRKRRKESRTGRRPRVRCQVVNFAKAKRRLARAARETRPTQF